MDGVTREIFDNINIFIIENLSDDLKREINKKIVYICYGNKINKTYKMYSVNSTIKELLERYPNDIDKQKGFIGELLVNVLVRIFLKNFSIVSPFFNKEERASAKKGFDIILRDSETCNMWIIESKAGTVSKRSDINKKIKERLRVAKNDLSRRLCESDNTQLWNNAINDVEICMNDSNEKDAFLEILHDSYENGTTSDKNIILAGTVFHKIDEKFNSDEILKYYINCKNEDIFNDIQIIAIQKSTFKKIIKYLESLE